MQNHTVRFIWDNRMRLRPAAETGAGCPILRTLLLILAPLVCFGQEPTPAPSPVKQNQDKLSLLQRVSTFRLIYRHL